MDIKPGQWINVKVTAQPKSEGARKTLIRVCEKDATVATERRRLHRARPVTHHRRGGRPWYDRPARLQIVKMNTGQTYKVFGSLDVLRDVASIRK